MSETTFDIIILGGGPSGSMAALTLARAGFEVCLVERKEFPRETLCGEFLSHEVVDILDECRLMPGFLELRPAPLSTFTLCSDGGGAFSQPLHFAAYGLKRSIFDEFLLNAALAQGVHVFQPAEAEGVDRRDAWFEVRISMQHVPQTLRSRWCIGAYGKSSSLDKHLGRPFVGARTRLNGVKVHIDASALAAMDADEIRLFTGPDMYCGINHVGNGSAAICFLERRRRDEVPPRSRLRQLASVNEHFARALPEHAMLLTDGAPIYGTGNIYFGGREIVENGIFMVGDAARVISPLAGDGIGMALQSSRLLGRLMEEHIHKGSDPEALEREYSVQWRELFGSRLRAAAVLQRVLLSHRLRSVAAAILSYSPSLLTTAIAATRRRTR